MLTGEALEEQRWRGLTTLRTLLHTKLAAFENGFYPTSIASAPPDVYRDLWFIAEPVKANRSELAAAIMRDVDAAARGNRLEETRQDMQQLASTLARSGDELRALARDVDAVSQQVAVEVRSYESP